MKIINTYLMPMVRSIVGIHTQTDLVEIIELENGMVFEVVWNNGERSYRKIHREQFEDMLKLNLNLFV